MSLSIKMMLGVMACFAIVNVASGSRRRSERMFERSSSQLRNMPPDLPDISDLTGKWVAYMIDPRTNQWIFRGYAAINLVDQSAAEAYLHDPDLDGIIKQYVYLQGPELLVKSSLSDMNNADERSIIADWEPNTFIGVQVLTTTRALQTRLLYCVVLIKLGTPLSSELLDNVSDRLQNAPRPGII